MSHRGMVSLTGIAMAILVLAFSAGSALGAGPGIDSGTAPAIHAGRAGGLVRPMGADGVLQLTAAAARLARGALTSGAGLGNPSPYCGNSCLPPLLYSGGPVMHAVTTHVIAWGAPSAFPAGYVSGYEHYLSDMSVEIGSSGNVSSVAQQYVDATGPALNSLTNDTANDSDTDSYPSSGCIVAGVSVCLTEIQILTEVAGVIERNGLSVNLNQSYIVLLPPGIDTCFDSTSTACEDQVFCAYHDLFTIGSAEATFTLLPYTDSAYSNGSGTCTAIPPGSAYPTPSDLYALDSIGTHELIESATDPEVGAGYTDVNGWEIADECAYDYGATSPATGGGNYNQLDNGDQYLIQMMWSNVDDNCEQGVGTSLTATLSHSASPVTNAPTAFTATLTGASASGATYEWSYVDPNGNPHGHVSTAATPLLNLSVAGSYTVWVLITDANGGTVTGVSDVTVASPPSSGFTWSPALPAVGTTVAFSEEGSAGTGSITGYSWNFGDGTGSNAANPSHSYSASGNYTATLTVTQTGGATATAQHTIAVAGTPDADFTWTPPNPTPGSVVTFKQEAAAASGVITVYHWDFGDGSTSPDPSPSHTYSVAGNYAVSLTVTQSDGLTATVQHAVAVATAASIPSEAAILRRALLPSRSATKIPTLLRKGGATVAVSSSNTSGRITITWYATVRHHRIVVARGSANVRSGVAAHVVIRLTAAGRALLHSSRVLRVTVSGVYTSGTSRVTAPRTITLRH